MKMQAKIPSVDVRVWLEDRLDEVEVPDWLQKGTCLVGDLEAVIASRWREVVALLLARDIVLSTPDGQQAYVIKKEHEGVLAQAIVAALRNPL